MKILTIITTALFLTHLTSCDSQTSDTSSLKSDTVIYQKAAIAAPVQTAQEPENTVTAFFTWYRDNRDKLSSFQLVNNASGETFDSTKFYSVNFTETEKYLNAIEASGFVSPTCIDNWKKYFKHADNQFKANPQNDGPPENFDYDLVMQSQEIDEDLANIAKAKVFSKSTDGDTALVTLSLPSEQKLKITLSRQNQKWLIDKVESATGK